MSRVGAVLGPQLVILVNVLIVAAFVLKVRILHSQTQHSFFEHLFNLYLTLINCIFEIGSYNIFTFLVLHAFQNK